MREKLADTSILWFVQWLAIGAFVASLLPILGYMLTLDDWTALAWYPFAMLVYFVVQVLAWVTLVGQNTRRKQIYRLALLPLIVAIGCVLGGWVTLIFFP